MASSIGSLNRFGAAIPPAADSLGPAAVIEDDLIVDWSDRLRSLGVASDTDVISYYRDLDSDTNRCDRAVLLTGSLIKCRGLVETSALIAKLPDNSAKWVALGVVLSRHDVRETALEHVLTILESMLKVSDEKIRTGELDDLFIALAREGLNDHILAIIEVFRCCAEFQYPLNQYPELKCTPFVNYDPHAAKCAQIRNKHDELIKEAIKRALTKVAPDSLASIVRPPFKFSCCRPEEEIVDYILTTVAYRDFNENERIEVCKQKFEQYSVSEAQVAYFLMSPKEDPVHKREWQNTMAGDNAKQYAGIIWKAFCDYKKPENTVAPPSLDNYCEPVDWLLGPVDKGRRIAKAAKQPTAEQLGKSTHKAGRRDALKCIESMGVPPPIDYFHVLRVQKIRAIVATEEENRASLIIQQHE